MTNLNVAAFLDRDGVIVDEVGHLTKTSELNLIPNSAKAIAKLNQSGVHVFVITNQSVVARGLISEDQVDHIHASLDDMLSKEGARIDAYYYCPHHPTEGSGSYRIACDCRKPGPELLRRAATDHRIDLGASVMIGDTISDLEAGTSAGCITILVRTGYGIESERDLYKSRPFESIVAEDLYEAVSVFLASYWE